MLIGPDCWYSVLGYPPFTLHTPPTSLHTIPRSKRNKKPLGDQGEKKKVVSIVTREFEVDSNASEEMVLSTGKNYLTCSVELAELARVHGSSLIQQLGDFTAKVSALDDKFI